MDERNEAERVGDGLGTDNKTNYRGVGAQGVIRVLGAREGETGEDEEDETPLKKNRNAEAGAMKKSRKILYETDVGTRRILSLTSLAARG